MADADVKPEVKPEGGAQAIELKFKFGDDAPVTFKVKSTTRFEKIVAAWAQKTGRTASQFRFHDPEGKPINAPYTMTVNDIGLEDGDQIDVMSQQVGGQYCH